VRPRVSAEPVGIWNWSDVHCRSLNDLRNLLVQSDDKRMDWFRELLLEKSRLFQVIVFTCRSGDYIAPAEHVPPDGPAFSTMGPVHAVNLDRAIQRR
jgi:hypothetical protein